MSQHHDARFFGEVWLAPAVISVSGMLPFKLYGYSSTLIWADNAPSRPGTLENMYGGGVNIISFHPPSSQLPAVKSGTSKLQSAIENNEDHTQAQTLIRRYSRGLGAEGIVLSLIKIGDKWFVTDLRMLYVS